MKASWRASIAHMTRAGVALVAVILAATLTAEAQELEPRTYSNTPVGMNFLLLGYSYSQGDVTFDSSTPIKDAELTVHSAVLAYARALGVWGRSAKLDVALPYAWLSGTAKVAGRPESREVSGLGDPRVRFSFLPYGAPALTLEQFEDYEQDFILGASVAVTVPLGQYDSNKLVNIGTNRWSVKPELGISKTWGPVTLELAPSVTFYTDNDDFFGGKKLEKEPLYAVQAHVIYHTRRGWWAAVDATYYTGGRTTVDGERGEEPENLRVGATLAIPIDRHNSVKLYGSVGAITRVGGNFTTAGVAWQFRWGGGL
jgi:Putative MetA-pathway of phenol degradation